VVRATDLLDDPHLAAAGFWRRAERRFVGTHVVPRAPYAIDGKFRTIDRSAPTLGEHNAEVLGELLGMPMSEVAALECDGIIGTRAV
jgi:crotonobetainyl-CoA:carnitine CoA-transferase CaiB-like acyl-CoA transferase